MGTDPLLYMSESRLPSCWKRRRFSETFFIKVFSEIIQTSSTVSSIKTYLHESSQTEQSLPSKSRFCTVNAIK